METFFPSSTMAVDFLASSGGYVLGSVDGYELLAAVSILRGGVIEKRMLVGVVGFLATAGRKLQR